MSASRRASRTQQRKRARFTGYELGWIVFLLGHVVCSIALHTITLYLSVATAYIRYKALDKLGSKWLQDSAAG